MDAQTQPAKTDLDKKLDPKQKAGWQISRHWLAGNSLFPLGRIFISSFFELLGMNIEGQYSLLLGIQLFI